MVLLHARQTAKVWLCMVTGIGPSVAIPDVVRRGGISIEDVDVFEVNEAFASQVSPAPSWLSAICVELCAEIAELELAQRCRIVSSS